MEKKVTNLIEKLMKSESIEPELLNELIVLYKTILDERTNYVFKRKEVIEKSEEHGNIFLDDYDVSVTKIEVPIDQTYKFDNQLKRLEMAFKDKIKEINLTFDDTYVDYITNIILGRNGKADIKELKRINGNELAIIREGKIELGDESFDANHLEAGLDLQEEAYLRKASRLNNEYFFSWDPAEEFKDFYDDIENKIDDLKTKLDVWDPDKDLYFDKELDSFYFDNVKEFRCIVTSLPDKIEIYDIKENSGKWEPTLISGSAMKKIYDDLNISLLKENFIVKNFKETYKKSREKADFFDIEMTLSEFKNSKFTIENLINTYKSLFNNSNCMFEENESNINRLKFIAVEKLVQSGLEYEKAFNYINVIFNIIDDYKKQINDAINGIDKFPNKSLEVIVKKLKP